MSGWLKLSSLLFFHPAGWKLQEGASVGLTYHTSRSRVGKLQPDMIQCLVISCSEAGGQVKMVVIYSRFRFLKA